MLYYAVKLTELEEDGKPNPSARTYGLIHFILTHHDKLTGHQEIVPHLIITDRSPRMLGKQYGELITASYYDRSHIALSFGVPLDTVVRFGQKIRVYQTEAFSIDLREKFNRGMLEEIAELSKP